MLSHRGEMAATRYERDIRTALREFSPEESSHASDPEEASLWFQGLPTPGAAGVIAGLALLVDDPFLRPGSWALKALPVLTFVLAVLMVSRLPYSHVANRFLAGRKPVHFLVMVLVVLVMALTYHFEASLAGGMIAYALSGPVTAIFRRRRGRGEVPAAAGEREVR